MESSYGKCFSYRPALSLKVYAFPCVHLSLSGSEIMDSDSDGSDDNCMKIERGEDSSSDSQLGHFVAMDYFSNFK